MFDFTTITQLIVGRAAAERSEYKRLDRKYKGAEANLKLVKEVTRSSPAASMIGSSNATSIRSTVIEVVSRDMGMAIAQTPGLHRALSTPAVASFPPGMLEPLKRTYSESQLPVQMPEMTGFGKYRRAANASVDWQLERLEQNFKNDGDIIADFLGDQPPFGLDPNVWKQYRETRVQKLKDCRRSSNQTYSSSRTSPSNGAAGPTVLDAATEYVCPDTGTKVVRGFSISPSTIAPPKSTSSASPVKKSSPFIMKQKKEDIKLNENVKAQITHDATFKEQVKFGTTFKDRMRMEMQQAECAIDSEDSDNSDGSEWTDDEE